MQQTVMHGDLVGTWQERLAGTPVNIDYYYYAW